MGKEFAKRIIKESVSEKEFQEWEENNSINELKDEFRKAIAKKRMNIRKIYKKYIG